MTIRAEPAELAKLRSRIRALRAKTVDNGCTEDEALAAAAKVAELLDRFDLSLGDPALAEFVCARVVYESCRKKRIPIADCIGAIAAFCDCRFWRERSETGETRFVFFGLPADTDAALYLTDLIDHTVRSELGRYKTSADYRRFPHQMRHLANASFALGMVTSIAARLDALKAERNRAKAGSGRDLVVIKVSIVEEELRRLGLSFKTTAGVRRIVSPDAFEAGDRATSAVSITARTQ